jgi:hypothetical protein
MYKGVGNSCTFMKLIETNFRNQHEVTTLGVEFSSKIIIQENAIKFHIWRYCCKIII